MKTSKERVVTPSSNRKPGRDRDVAAGGVSRFCQTGRRARTQVVEPPLPHSTEHTEQRRARARARAGSRLAEGEGAGAGRRSCVCVRAALRVGQCVSECVPGRSVRRPLLCVREAGAASRAVARVRVSAMGTR
eukprot:2464147-Prymnesium_polylepis.1